MKNRIQLLHSAIINEKSNAYFANYFETSHATMARILNGQSSFSSLDQDLLSNAAYDCPLPSLVNDVNLTIDINDTQIEEKTFDFLIKDYKGKPKEVDIFLEQVRRLIFRDLVYDEDLQCNSANFNALDKAETLLRKVPLLTSIPSNRKKAYSYYSRHNINSINILRKSCTINQKDYKKEVQTGYTLLEDIYHDLKSQKESAQKKKKPYIYTTDNIQNLKFILVACSTSVKEIAILSGMNSVVDEVRGIEKSLFPTVDHLFEKLLLAIAWKHSKPYIIEYYKPITEKS